MSDGAATFTVIEHGSRRRAIVHRILEGVFSGRFQAGDRLKVEHLALQFEVSATPVRESLVELAGIGIVDLLPNRGAVLRAFGAQQVRELCQVRRILEAEAARCATSRISRFELLELEADLQRLIETPRGEAWSDETRLVDSRLHELIAARCGSERLAHEINRYRNLYRTLRDVLHQRRKARSDYQQLEENSEHLAIVRPLLAGDAEAAAAAMMRHIYASSDIWIRDLFAADNSQSEMSRADSLQVTLHSEPQLAATHT